MRILQLVPQSRVGGAENVGFTLAAELARRGHQTLLLSNRDNGPLLARERPAGMDVGALNRTSRLDPRMPSFLGGAIRAFRPDVIHAHNYEAATWARVLGLFHPRIAMVVHVHGSRFVHTHGRRRTLTDRLLYRWTDAVIVLNDAQTEFLRETVHVDPQKLVLVPNGIDTGEFAAPEGAARSVDSVTCVASLTPVKNHAGLLRAWALVARERPQARLTLVGEGPLRASLEAQAREAGIAGSVVFAGAREDVRPFLWAAAVFVLPSHLEALPLSLLEGMAGGCAPVATRAGGIPDVVEDGITGLLVPPGDDDALARALLALLADPARCAELAERARVAVAQRFGLAPWVDRIESIYADCIARRNR
jgi:glycosyltransferase involved in cell wall biosynthesis